MYKLNLPNGRIIVLLVLLVIVFGQPVFSQDTVVRTPEEILAEVGDIPTPEAIHELFVNCSEWDEAHADVRDSSREALVEMGVLAVSTLLSDWLDSKDLRRRIELDNIINAIGHDATPHLIPYLENDDYFVRRHASYLLGNVAFIKTLEDPLAVGLMDEDEEAMEALLDALEAETDWHALRMMLNAIGDFRDPEQVELLASYLDNEEEAVRLGAVTGLGKIPSQEAASKLIRAFADERSNVRGAAILAVSTKTMGNFAFEALIGGSILSPGGQTSRLCAMESVWRYLSNIAADHGETAWEQRRRAYSTAVSIIDTNLESAGPWQVRGYAVEIIGHTYGVDAKAYLTALQEDEEHPFVLGKIEEALNRLDEGMPEEETE